MPVWCNKSFGAFAFAWFIIACGATVVDRTSYKYNTVANPDGSMADGSSSSSAYGQPLLGRRQEFSGFLLAAFPRFLFGFVLFRRFLGVREFFFFFHLAEDTRLSNRITARASPCGFHPNFG